MERIIDHFLVEWKNQEGRKSLILRCTRQVGKTHAVRVLGKTFTNFVEINLEVNESARNIIEADLDFQRLVLQLSELLQKTIQPGKTLFFID